MGAKKQIQVVFKIKDQEHWEKTISSENDKVSVIDCHLDWCGPCEVIEPNFRQMYFLIENAANRLEFLTVSDKEMPEGKADQMKLSAKPRFLIYKDGVCHKEVDGVLINDIENEVNRLLPPSDD